MKNINKYSKKENVIDENFIKFSKAKIELDKINKKIQPFKVKSGFTNTSTIGKWIETSSTFESNF